MKMEATYRRLKKNGSFFSSADFGSHFMMQSIRGARKNKINKAFLFGNCLVSIQAHMGAIVITNNYVFGLSRVLFMFNSG